MLRTWLQDGGRAYLRELSGDHCQKDGDRERRRGPRGWPHVYAAYEHPVACRRRFTCPSPSSVHGCRRGPGDFFPRTHDDVFATRRWTAEQVNVFSTLCQLLPQQQQQRRPRAAQQRRRLGPGHGDGLFSARTAEHATHTRTMTGGRRSAPHVCRRPLFFI